MKPASLWSRWHNKPVMGELVLVVAWSVTVAPRIKVSNSYIKFCMALHTQEQGYRQKKGLLHNRQVFKAVHFANYKWNSKSSVGKIVLDSFSSVIIKGEKLVMNKLYGRR